MRQATHVTVALPLYRSAPFLDNITANLERLPRHGIQIIVSDRHGADDAIDQLRYRFAGDLRFRFIQASDELDWIAHYNLLLREADGDYFMWMPHDDHYPDHYVPRLIEALESDPAAVAAFGQRRLLYLSGRRPVGEPRLDEPPRFFFDMPWSPWQTLRLLVSWNIAVPFRGLFRRRLLVENGLFLPCAVDGVAADVYWMFCVGLHGPLTYTPRTWCIKYRHKDSLSATWRYSVKYRHLTDGLQILKRCLDAAAISPSDKRRMEWVLMTWTGFKLLYFGMARVPLPGFRDFAQLTATAGLRVLRVLTR